MRSIPLYEQWIAEGGFASVKTQDTPLTPEILGKTVELTEKLSAEFNKRLSELELPSLDFLKPVGSGSWWEDDLKRNPDKLYGDIDYMVAYPTLGLGDGKGGRADEIATVKMYNQEWMDWMRKKKFDWIDMKETEEASTDSSIKVIYRLDLGQKTGWVQADMVVTHKAYQDWAVFRFTPMRGVKGYVMGNMYSAFGKLLELNIGNRGVKAKFIGDVQVPQSKRKDVTERDISQNAETYMMDIARFFWEQSKTTKPFEPAPRLASWSMDTKNPTLEGLCEGIRGVVETLESLGEFGSIIKHKTARQFLSDLADLYDVKMERQATSSKLDKAETPAAKAAVQLIRDTSARYSALGRKYLTK